VEQNERKNGLTNLPRKRRKPQTTRKTQTGRKRSSLHNMKNVKVLVLESQENESIRSFTQILMVC